MKLLAVCLLSSLAAALTVGAMTSSKGADKPKLAHMVFFTLKERTSTAREKLIAACQKYLGGHEGTVYFSVGAIAEDVKEPVSDREFDVALHLVFEDKDALAKYTKDPRHVKFIDENKDAWSKVRVFDSYLDSPSK